jgi:hypothetical protein
MSCRLSACGVAVSGGQRFQHVEPARKMLLGWIHSERAYDYTTQRPICSYRMVVIRVTL